MKRVMSDVLLKYGCTKEQFLSRKRKQTRNPKINHGFGTNPIISQTSSFLNVPDFE